MGRSSWGEATGVEGGKVGGEAIGVESETVGGGPESRGGQEEGAETKSGRKSKGDGAGAEDGGDGTGSAVGGSESKEEAGGASSSGRRDEEE